MKKIKKVNRVGYFEELSKKDKQRISGGIAIGTSFMRELISYFAPRTND